MLSLSSIETMFREMGLGSEEDRKRFLPLAESEGKTEKASTEVFITVANTSAYQEEGTGAELGPDPRGD